MFGTDHEREMMRSEIDKQHRQVRSGPGSSVPYNAFDRNLQLWVAACIYYGVEDVYTRLHGSADSETLAALSRHSARFATTLQVPQDMWPADRAAFAEYWNASLRLVQMDEVTRTFLNDFVSLTFLPTPLHQILGPLHRFITSGFLPPVFRDELGLPWSRRRQ